MVIVSRKIQSPVAAVLIAAATKIGQ